MKKKILITYATAGIGHKKAALAVYEALLSGHKNMEVKLVDILDYTNFLFREIYCVIYLFLITRLTFLWGFFYYSLDCKLLHYLTSPLRRAVHVLNSGRFVRFMLDYKPDVVVSTHFLVPDICYYLKRRYRMKVHVINVITDYRPHSFWVSEAVDTYAVGHVLVKDGLVKKWKVPVDNIRVTGIPIEEKFSKEEDKFVLRKRFGISEESFTILLLSGGYGVGPVLKILALLNKANFPITAIAVCGHNKKLYAKLENFKKIANIQIMNLGFVDNVNELMACSDVCIGKAGGMSTSEAFAKDLPFIFVKPIPGQERANAELFIKTGAGLRLDKIKNVLEIIEELRNSTDKMLQLKESAKCAGKPHAARDIAEFVNTKT